MKLQVTQSGQQTFSIVGTNFRLIESVAPVQVKFLGGEKDQQITLERGMAFEPRGGFEQIIVNSEVDQIITIEATIGAIDDNRISGEIRTRDKPYSGLNISDVVVNDISSLIIVGSSTRLKLTIKNTGLEVVNLASQADVLAASYPLLPNETLVIDTAASASVYALSTAAGTTLSFIEEYQFYSGSILGSYVLDENGNALLDENGNYILSEG
ncbi:MAG: hypothetical protein ISEC1_P1936 [Thiomicrorhabdus sp.]|nr:MAG: hypothetical protein ISEC1_P1936 [Thiomicrorhabdus sp.]